MVQSLLKYLLVNNLLFYFLLRKIRLIFVKIKTVENKLTNKALKDFGICHFERDTPIEGYKNFPTLSQSAKNGVYLEWFDSVKLFITVSYCVDKTFDSFVANDKYEGV